MQKLSRVSKSLKDVSKTDHFVHFYQDDKHLYENLSHYILEGLNSDETCIIIGTPKTIIQVNKIIRASRIDLAEVIDSGKYIAIDAEELLNTIMSNQKVDAAKFMVSIGSIMKLASSKRDRPIRAFGDMVAILLDKGNIKAVNQLESYWNNLSTKISFSLYCAYPEKLYRRTIMAHSELFSDLCSCHKPSFN